MNIEAISSAAGAPQFQLSKGSDQVTEARKKVVDMAQNDQVEKKQVQPEELLKQIKALTEEGLYSVRFENDDLAGVVVKIVDRENDEIIRQFPAEEILQLNAVLADLRGNMFDAFS